MSDEARFESLVWTAPELLRLAGTDYIYIRGCMENGYFMSPLHGVLACSLALGFVWKNN